MKDTLAPSAHASRRHQRMHWTRESVGGVGRARPGTGDSSVRGITELPGLLARAGLELPAEALPISKFKASYAEALQRVKDGQPQLLTQGRTRFFILSEEQVLQLLEAPQSELTLSGALEGLPAAPAGDAPLRAGQLPESLGQHWLGD